jgi:hypothetical protein
VSFSLSVAPQNRRREVGVRHASRSSSLFHVEASLARVFQSGLKTGGGATSIWDIEHCALTQLRQLGFLALI